MDKRSQPRSKTPGKNLPPPERKRLPFWLVHFLLGLVLIVAGALKFYELAFESWDERAPTLLLMVFAEVELLGGIWMAAWFDPVRTRWWGAAAFVGLALASFSQGLAGKCSCGCFGGLTISPWLTLVFDLAAITALLGSRPAGASGETFPIVPTHWIGLGAIALLIAIAGWRQAGLVTMAGTATVDGHPLEEGTLTFTGESGKFVLQTDHDGHFRLPLVRPGQYAVSAPGQVVAHPVTKAVGTAKGPRRMRDQKRIERPRTLPSPAGANPPVSWFEVPVCSRDNVNINL